MSSPRGHDHHHPAGDDPGWSLLRLSALQRLGLALVLVAGLWLATAAVIA